MKKFLSILCVIVSFACLSFAFAGCGKETTPLSDADRDLLRYYREATIDDDFDDNKVTFALKSAFSYLEELSFDEFKGVNEIAPIAYVEVRYDMRYEYKSGETFPLEKKEITEHHVLTFILKEHNKEKVLKACNQLEKLDMVLCAEPDFIFDIEFTGTTSDSEYKSQWALNGTNGINIEQAWDITRGDTNVKIGVLESNIDMEHPDLKGRVFYGNSHPHDSCNKFHGTKVAGIIGAIQNNIGIAGIAKCSIYLLYYEDLKGSLEWAEANGVKIVCACLSLPFNTKHYEAIKAYDGLFIAAAANDYRDNDDDYGLSHNYPSDYDLPNIISVGAHGKDGSKYISSNYGKISVDLFAPGEEILSTSPDNDYGILSQTSAAAPHVAGVAALIYSLHTNIAVADVKYAILNGVDKVDALKDMCVSGGKLNAYKALNAVKDSSHIFSYECIDKNNHRAICDGCGYTVVEAHTWGLLNGASSTLNENDVNSIVVPKHDWYCEKCHAVLHSNGLISIIHSKEEEETE